MLLSALDLLIASYFGALTSSSFTDSSLYQIILSMFGREITGSVFARSNVIIGLTLETSRSNTYIHNTYSELKKISE